MHELRGKAKRVAGTFAIMLGISLMLDTHAFASGGALVLAGVVALVWGLLEGRTSAADVVPERPAGERLP